MTKEQRCQVLIEKLAQHGLVLCDGASPQMVVDAMMTAYAAPVRTPAQDGQNEACGLTFVRTPFFNATHRLSDFLSMVRSSVLEDIAAEVIG